MSERCGHGGVRRRRLRWLAAGVGVLCVAVLPGVAAASPAPAGTTGPAPVMATYDGRTIDLSQGWQGAQGCAVLGPTEVHCYATVAEMRAALGAPPPTTGTPATGTPATGTPTTGTPTTGTPAAPLTTCGGNYLWLYSGPSFSGTSIAIATYGTWVNLASYGFGPDLGSWTNQATCAAAVATGTNGSGSILSMGAQTWSYTVGSPWSTDTHSAYLS